jgi:hypothetical protein
MPKEKTQEEIKNEKKATLTKFLRFKKGDSDVIEEVTEILTEDKLAKLEENKRYHAGEITRQRALLVEVEAEIASLK